MNQTDPWAHLQSLNADTLSQQTYHHSTSLRLYSKVPITQGEILDFGCGNGWFTLWLNAHRGPTIGVDAMIGNYLPMIPRNQHVLFQERLPSHTEHAGRFQVISADNVLEHLEDPVDSLCHLNALLAPGGQLHILVPLDGLDLEWNTLAHCWKITPRELEDTLTLCGFGKSFSEEINTLESGGWVLPSCKNLMYHGIFIKSADRMADSITLAKTRAQLREHTRANMARNPSTKEFRAGAIFNEGRSLAAGGRHAEAILQYQEAIWINPFYKNAYHEMAVAHAALGQWDEARKPLEHLLNKVNSDHAPARILLIQILQELKATPSDIAAQWKELKERNPDAFSRLK